MITLPTTKSPPAQLSPNLTLLFGQSKIGKTSMIAQLEDCLLIDTEKGAGFVEAMRVEVGSLAELKEVSIALEKAKSEGKMYKHIAIDTIDNIADWCDERVLYNYNHPKNAAPPKMKANALADIPYGGGYAASREMVMNIVLSFREFTNRLIIVGHRKQTIIGESKVEFASSSLDLTGKLKNHLCANADAIGYVHRDKEGNLLVSFKPSDELEAGSRCAHLKGKIFPFEWKNIFID